MKKAELVIIPAPGMGHLVSTVEFSKHLLDLDSRLSITVLVITPFAPSVGEYTRSLASSDTRIRYLDLPRVDPPPPQFLSSPEKFVTVFIESHKQHAKDAIIDLVSSESNSNSTSKLVGLVVDMFCTSMIDIAHQLGLPSYLFFTSSAAFLGFLLYLPTRYDQVGTEFKESDPESIIPSYVNPVPTDALPSFAFNKDGYASFSGHARKFRETKGIIVNTFAELESHALNSFLDDQTPPVYTVGPLLDLKGQGNSQSNRAHRDKIIKWLDDQPQSSVVFLCFGSLGCFGAAQANEIAVALERSGHRFLWSLRQPPPQGEFAMPSDYANFEGILPEGFLERIGGRGMMCGWAPQVEVLAHKAIGGFVSHCGWNSILESIRCGVPLVTWPMYAEQQINAFEMARELGLAVGMKVDYRTGGGDVVKADEIETAIGRLMEHDGEVRKRVKEMGEKSRMALVEGGSSLASFGRLIKDILGNKS
ncbi:hypothetical protein L1049_024339 [Liquidambar formosana]|uniref:Glycosyltransferase n=1 Tax=Liquidambar formosana TaxID=63359 RepID=A0AAP0S1C8_LIQFO